MVDVPIFNSWDVASGSMTEMISEWSQELVIPIEFIENCVINNGE